MGMSLTQKAQDVHEWVFFPQAHVMRLSKTGIRSSGQLMDAEGARGGGMGRGRAGSVTPGPLQSL